ncbi:hypothetical protein BDZ89DRAFT_1057063 [Hymenopellis radicata]|nr:hypothetical protein BDZ89DRAFT_1057063 [Hymenopellis radicata]
MLATPVMSHRKPTRDNSMLPARSPHPELGGQNCAEGGLQSPFCTPAVQTLSWRPRHDDGDSLVFNSPQPLLTPSRQKPAHSPGASPAPQTSRVGAGTKRKTTPQATPLRPHTLTPLVTFTEMDASLRSQTTTLTHLNLNQSTDTGLDDEDDSGCDISEPPKGVLFAENKQVRRSPPNRLFKDVQAAEVIEAVSPGGHITKRRARSRPVSDELLESIRSSPSPAERPPPRNLVAFPGKKIHHRRKSSGSSSSSSAASPHPRPRLTGLNGTASARPSHLRQRAPMARVDSATLFFGGPSVQQPPAVRSRTNTSLSNTNDQFLVTLRPSVSNRHSYAGTAATDYWSAIQPRSMLPSPQSSPSTRDDQDTAHEDTDDDDMFHAVPPDSSFVLTIDTPSPREKATITSKFKQARDSGVGLSDDDMSMDSTASAENLMPQASTSVSSIYSDGDDEGLVTPGVLPSTASGWPQARVYGRDDDTGGGVDMDAFILRTLTTTTKGPNEVKKAPNTPVKKVKTSYLSGDRPWQSAVAHRVGRGIDWEVKAAKAPRKSMPAVFSLSGRKHGKSPFDPSTDSEDEQDSPSTRKERYAGLGLGRPVQPDSLEFMPPTLPKPRWLTRRSSSGNFSSGSDSMSTIGTPTRNNTGASRTSRLSPQHLSRFSPARSTRSASGSSTSSILSSPTLSRVHPSPGKQRPSVGRKSFLPRPSLPSSQDQGGRFDRDFVIVDQIGSGEFGKVIKARSKIGEETYAIKKSKPFEGVKHRYRLREEADILRHLGQVNGGRRHPNVLAFVDSWEEDEVLYIQTELCELGSLGHFLWEYGRAFPRLDEARVWKIIADLSNGLMFIHTSGVIHLDIKPANIFVTSEGRFKIGDFGMASLWPRPVQSAVGTVPPSAFEREGDKLYLAPEVLQGKYGKAADVFSFGMTMLETASNIVVPDQGESWHRLRREDFSQVDLDDSPELLELIRQMMRTDPTSRISMRDICAHAVVRRARSRMDKMYETAKLEGSSLFSASPLASVTDGFLEDILGRDMSGGGAMDLSP